MLHPGQAFNDSTTFPDRATGRLTRKLSSRGSRNQTPTYHLNACFTADSRQMVYVTSREDCSAIILADCETGDSVVVDVSPDPSASGLCGQSMTMVQPTHHVAISQGRRLVLYDLKTLARRVLVADVGEGYRIAPPAPTPDGSRIILNRMPRPPAEVAANGPLAVFQHFVDTYGGMPLTYLEVEVATGACEEVMHEPVAGSNHTQVCPSDADLWLIDRDWPPRFSWGGDDGRTNRAWTYRRSTGEMKEIERRDRNGFQIHTNWSRDGQRIYYHGRHLPEGVDYPPPDACGQYIGVADREGLLLWEWVFEGHFFYGHACTHTTRELFLTDGLVTPNEVCSLDYGQAGDDGRPHIEVLARHDTRWDEPKGQYSHPHCHMSPDGRWLTYNRGEGAASHVYVVDLASGGNAPWRPPAS